MIISKKLKKKNKSIFLLIVIIVNLISGYVGLLQYKPAISSSITNNKRQDSQKLKSSGYWNLTGSPIKIDDISPFGDYINWSEAALQSWVSGNGTLNNPYIIENVFIDGQGFGDSIEIKDSNVFFEIRNSTLINAGSGSYDAGIKLENVVNGKLINNTVSFNLRNGIIIGVCQNTTISENLVENNGNDLTGGVGINFWGINCSVSKNNIKNSGSGFQEVGAILGGYNNKIFKNNITDHPRVTLGDGGSGILIRGVNQKIYKNIIKNNERFGIDWSGNFNNNSISDNIISNNGDTGINIVGIGSEPTKNITVTNNVISYNQYGIKIHNSRYHTITGNSILDNSQIGIRVYSGHNSNISNNIIKNNGIEGMWINQAQENNITNNKIVGNGQYGINVFYPSSSFNRFYRNLFIDNGINARDNSYLGTDQWNNSIIGNYWDDHIIIDLDKDGIVDSPYTSIVGPAGCIDYLPIYINPDPYFINNPDNFSILAGESLNSIIWTPMDENTDYDSFWMHLNGVNVYNGTWDGSRIIYTDLSNLDVGFYNLTCFVNDTYGAVNSSTVFLTVLFNNNPQIYNTTENFIVNNGTTGFSLSWHAIDVDANNQSYWIERNSVQIQEGFWNNDSDIVYFEFDILPPGDYNYTCFVNDTIDARNQSSVFIRINSYPYYFSITYPSDNVYSPLGNYTFNCTWVDNDDFIQEVKFEFNHQNYSATNNYSGEYTYTIKGLSANENGYAFRWHAKDNEGLWRSTEWYTFVLLKQVVHLRILFNGSQVNLIDSYNPLVNITVVNLNSTLGNLKLFVDSQLIQQANDYSLTNISQYLIGYYNITSILTDQNYTGYTMQWLNIQETIPPDIIFEFSEFYLNTTKPEYFHRSLRIICTVSDSSPLEWVDFFENSSGMFVNHSMVSLGNGNWTHEMDISHLNWNDEILFYFSAKDFWGNVGINDNLTFLYTINILDFQNPVSTISHIPYINPNIINETTTFTINADDHLGSGIAQIMYKIDDSDWEIFTQPFNLSNYQSGTHIISYYSIDNAGNIEEINSILVVLTKIDDSNAQRTATIPGFNIIMIISVISIIIIIIISKNKLT